jgi:AraC-like DNA-binding protein
MLLKKIKTYPPKAFTARYMPSPELLALLKGDFDRFFIVKVEEMYRHVQQAVPASRATNHTCIYLTDGEARMKIGTEQVMIGKGAMLFVPAGQVFSFEQHDINKGYICAFHDEMLLESPGNGKLLQEFTFLSLWANPVVQPDKQTSGYILQLLKRMYKEYGSNGLERIDILRAYCRAMLCEVKGVYQPYAYNRENAGIHILRRFRELLASRSGELHRVSEYAALLHVSPNHLNKAVKSASGKSPTQWIDDTILTEAKILLWQTELSINEIAAELGFEDPSYFSRLFKKYERVTPSDYRHGLKNPE